jgi:hypothetical protein
MSVESTTVDGECRTCQVDLDPPATAGDRTPGEGSMGHQLVVWEGTRPADHETGARECDAVSRAYLVDAPVPPTPAILNFVGALTRIWPDRGDEAFSEGSPWKYEDIASGASGPAFYVNMTLRGGQRVSPVIAEIAEDFGLVTYDLMFGLLRPVPESVVAERIQALLSGEFWEQREPDPTSSRIRPWRSRSSRRSA